LNYSPSIKYIAIVTHFLIDVYI